MKSSKSLLPAFVFGLLFLITDLSANPVHVLMMIGEREYRTRETLPAFAKDELEPRGFKVTIVHHDPENPNHFPGLEALKEADVLILSVRRRALSEAQMALIRQHFDSGKGLVAIRTASHAFSLRDQPSPERCVQWPDFDREVLGHDYEGHYSNKEGTRVTPRKVEWPVGRSLDGKPFKSGGTLYRARNLKEDTTVLMTGSCVEKGKERSEPVAFIRQWNKCRVFYTSLGHPDDFSEPAFRRLLNEAIAWAAGW